MTTLALGLRQSSVGGSNVTPGDLPVLRRDMLQEDDFFVLLEDASKIVFTFGTFDPILLEDASFLLQEDSFKLQIQSN